MKSDWLFFCGKILYNVIQNGVIVLLENREGVDAEGMNVRKQVMVRIMSAHKIPGGFAPIRQGRN